MGKRNKLRQQRPQQLQAGKITILPGTGRQISGGVLPHTLKAVSRIRADIQSWNRALDAARQAEPNMVELQELYTDCTMDATLSSQVQNRKLQLAGSPWNLEQPGGTVHEEASATLRNLPAFTTLLNGVLDAQYYGYSLVELHMPGRGQASRSLQATNLPRTHVSPALGRFYPDPHDPLHYTHYRQLREYGTYLLEVDTGELGLLNKAVPHVLFKRFAQSCWSELCEVYGIPPRVMKTNVQDPGMLSRAERMMKDMGAAAWFVIDETESFEWATAATTNGDVYNNLMRACAQEISLLISSAVIGQDTQHGNRSKEDSAQELLWNLVIADMQWVEQQFNHLILPALARLGIIPAGLRLKFEPEADLEQLWKYTQGLLQHYTIPPDWIRDTFGVQVEAPRTQPIAGEAGLGAAGFFD
ncbi:MAG TPA: DUF935 family protein [Phnomibacter sp.]|nr:DUF935 family protein [Phnomibacter sp.]